MTLTSWRTPDAGNTRAPAALTRLTPCRAPTVNPMSDVVDAAIVFTKKAMEEAESALPKHLMEDRETAVSMALD